MTTTTKADVDAALDRLERDLPKMVGDPAPWLRLHLADVRLLVENIGEKAVAIGLQLTEGERVAFPRFLAVPEGFAFHQGAQSHLRDSGVDASAPQSGLPAVPMLAYADRGDLTRVQWAVKYRAQLSENIGQLTRVQWCAKWGIPKSSADALFMAIGLTNKDFAPPTMGPHAGTHYTPAAKSPTRPVQPPTPPAAAPRPPEAASAPPAASAEPAAAVVDTPDDGAYPLLPFVPRLKVDPSYHLSKERVLEDYASALEAFYEEFKDAPWISRDLNDPEYDQKMYALTMASGVIEYLRAVLGRQVMEEVRNG